MQEQFLLGILLGLLAGLVNGVFLLPMRYTRGWAWENTWLLFTIISTGILPWVAALWYGGILMYNSSGVKLGRHLGPSISFALFAGGTVLFASLFGWLAGEWKG